MTATLSWNWGTCLLEEIPYCVNSDTDMMKISIISVKNWLVRRRTTAKNTLNRLTLCYNSVSRRLVGLSLVAKASHMFVCLIVRSFQEAPRVLICRPVSGIAVALDILKLLRNLKLGNSRESLHVNTWKRCLFTSCTIWLWFNKI